MRCVEWRVHSEFEFLLMRRFGADISKIADIRIQGCKPFGSSDYCQRNAWGFEAIGENGRGCRSLIRRQDFWVDGYVERCFLIGSDLFGSCNSCVTATCVYPLNAEYVFAYISCGYGSCDGTVPFWRAPKSMCCCARINSVADSLGLLTRKIINPEISNVGMMMRVRIARLDMIWFYLC